MYATLDPKAIFAAALDLRSEADLAPFLHEACAGDLDVRARFERHAIVLAYDL